MTKTITKNDAKNVVDKSQKTFTLATLARELSLNEKIVRSRFRRYANDEKNIERQKIVNSHVALGHAKSRWVYVMKHYNAIREIVKRVDD